MWPRLQRPLGNPSCALKSRWRRDAQRGSSQCCARMRRRLHRPSRRPRGVCCSSPPACARVHCWHTARCSLRRRRALLFAPLAGHCCNCLDRRWRWRRAHLRTPCPLVMLSHVLRRRPCCGRIEPWRLGAVKGARGRCTPTRLMLLQRPLGGWALSQAWCHHQPGRQQRGRKALRGAAAAAAA